MRDVFALFSVPAVDGEDFFHLSRCGTPRDDRACDARLLRGERYTADQILQAEQRIQSAVAVYGGAAASMAGRPCVHEDQRLFAAHLADNDTVRRETQRLSKKVFHIYGVRRRQCDLVLCRTLEFLRVLDGDDTFIEFGNLGKDGIQKCRLAGSRAACRNVAFCS